jgi:hypothetical protein
MQPRLNNIADDLSASGTTRMQVQPRLNNIADDLSDDEVEARGSTATRNLHSAGRQRKEGGSSARKEAASIDIGY